MVEHRRVSANKQINCAHVWSTSNLHAAAHRAAATEGVFGAFVGEPYLLRRGQSWFVSVLGSSSHLMLGMQIRVGGAPSNMSVLQRFAMGIARGS